MPRGWVVYVHSLDLDDDLPALCFLDFHIRLAEDHEEVTRTCLLEQFIAAAASSYGLILLMRVYQLLKNDRFPPQVPTGLLATNSAKVHV